MIHSSIILFAIYVYLYAYSFFLYKYNAVDDID